MKKQHKKRFLIRKIRQKEFDMKIQRKRMIPGVKSKTYLTKADAIQLGTKKRKNRHVGTKYRCGVMKHRLSQTASFSRAVEQSIADTMKNGNPVARYDVQRRQAYLEYPDGKRAYVE